MWMSEEHWNLLSGENIRYKEIDYVLDGKIEYYKEKIIPTFVLE